jgi:hypothetical protein
MEPVGFSLGWAEDRRRLLQAAVPPGLGPLTLTEAQIADVLMCSGYWEGQWTGEQPVPSPRRFRSGLFRRLAREFMEALVAGVVVTPKDFVADFLATDENFDVLYGTWLLLMPTPAKIELAGELSSSLSNLLAAWPVISATGELGIGPVLDEITLGDLTLEADQVDLTLGDRHLGVDVAWPGSVLVRFVVAKPYPRFLEKMVLSAVVHGLVTGCPPSRVVAYGLTTGEGIGMDVERQWIEMGIASVKQAVHEIGNFRQERPIQISAGHHCVKCTHCNTCPISEKDEYPF